MMNSADEEHARKHPHRLGHDHLDVSGDLSHFLFLVTEVQQVQPTPLGYGLPMK